MSSVSEGVNENVRNRIRTLREAHGLTQQELADDLGVAQQRVAKWEKGTNRIQLPQLVQLATRFRVSTDTILGLAPMPVASTVESALMQDPDLSPRQRAALLEAYRVSRGFA